MTIHQTLLASFVVANAMLWLPTDVGGQVGEAFGDGPTLAVMLRVGNGEPPSQPVVNLTWKASKSAGVKYNIYRSRTKGGCLKTKSNDCTKINRSPVTGTTYTDDTVQPGQSYFYVAKSVNASGKESGPSNEAPAAP